jgi:hypothetical protein
VAPPRAARRSRATLELRAEVTPPAVEEPTSPSPLAAEAASLSRALRKLRDEGDAAAALTILDEHDARFGAGGPLGREATMTRIEAWLRAGQHAPALARLDELTLPPKGRERALLAARAELRAEAGRCDDARQDFERLLAASAADDAVAERALHGRAACRASAGDLAGARADLEAYLARFPAGRFVAAARAALGR